MRVPDVILKLRKRDDARALEHAEQMAVRSPAERAVSADNLEGMQADLLAGEFMLEVGLGEAKRLAE